MDFLKSLTGRITTTMKVELAQDYTEEVFVALKQMNPIKAPKSNGVAPIFFQQYWSAVGKPTTATVLQALNVGEFLTSLNHTFITLIPKMKSLTKVVDHRPISLCNVMYKIIFKVIANRLKKILPAIILNSQSAFVFGRLH